MGDDGRYWLGFSVFPGIGPIRFRLLREYFGSVRAAWEAPAATLAELGLTPRLTAEFVQFRGTFRPESYERQLRADRIGWLTLDDPRYPSRLRQIPDAPFVLYTLGKRPAGGWDLDRCIALVGTRRMTPYGREVTRELVCGLIGGGYTIVSGMAMGIDAAAHAAALDSGGKTIAVLGCGVDIAAPACNELLYRRIRDSGQGAIVSEMPLGHRPSRGLFPARNRIISGLCRAVVVVEGATDSGALITARYAGEQGRDVMAVPGPVTSKYSLGPLRLVRDGAIPVGCAADVLEALGETAPVPAGSPPDAGSVAEQRIRELLAGGALHIDAIVENSGFPAAQVLALLTEMELNGTVHQTDFQSYVLSRTPAR